MQLFKDKESKMIKLLLSIKKRGVDIDKIYNHDVVNNQSQENSDMENCIPENLKVKEGEENSQDLIKF